MMGKQFTTKLTLELLQEDKVKNEIDDFFSFQNDHLNKQLNLLTMQKMLLDFLFHFIARIYGYVRVKVFDRCKIANRI